jgi:hypothetical protein
VNILQVVCSIVHWPYNVSNDQVLYLVAEVFMSHTYALQYTCQSYIGVCNVVSNLKLDRILNPTRFSSDTFEHSCFCAQLHCICPL